jgi:hypothetical protein
MLSSNPVHASIIVLPLPLLLMLMLLLLLLLLRRRQELRMRSTNVTGRLPDSFALLTELRALDLANNNMTGQSTS